MFCAENLRKFDRKPKQTPERQGGTQRPMGLFLARALRSMAFGGAMVNVLNVLR